MSQQGSGYRVALSLQYSATFEQDEDTSSRDAYLLLAYRANPFVYVIGVVFHTCAELEKDDVTTDYDAANGAVVYLENVGSSTLAGWGLSYTSLDIEEKDIGTSFDASRAELYYRWRFQLPLQGQCTFSQVAGLSAGLYLGGFLGLVPV